LQLLIFFHLQPRYKSHSADDVKKKVLEFARDLKVRSQVCSCKNMKKEGYADVSSVADWRTKGKGSSKACKEEQKKQAAVSKVAIFLFETDTCAFFIPSVPCPLADCLGCAADERNGSRS
jgi:hypothetical protein